MNQPTSVVAIICSIIVTLFVIYVWIDFLFVKVLKDIALTSKSSKPIYIRLRRLYWKAALKKIRAMVMEYESDIDFVKDTASTIMLYELDVSKYKETFILYGYDRLRLDVVSISQKIEAFVEYQKEKDYYYTADHILELYLSDFDNQKKY